MKDERTTVYELVGGGDVFMRLAAEKENCILITFRTGCTYEGLFILRLPPSQRSDCLFQ